jgi:hypothetical protein
MGCTISIKKNKKKRGFTPKVPANIKRKKGFQVREFIIPNFCNREAYTSCPFHLMRHNIN